MYECVFCSYLQSNNLSQLNINAFGENMANLTTLWVQFLSLSILKQKEI